ncbi:MAG: SDR family NAD(P)-dependent oxidoreductase [Acidimicrobiia bacterium]|nr:SDR family NAD(P)-dependent oxidoreductase [Acidimicrobiia bacterium]
MPSPCRGPARPTRRPRPPSSLRSPGPCRDTIHEEPGERARRGVISLSPVASLEADEWDRVMDVNAKGVFLTCKAAVPHLVGQRHSCFVNAASIAGKRGGANAAHYCASKFAVVGFTQSLALEAAPHGVRANAICPGYLGTSMWLNDILAHQP